MDCGVAFTETNIVGKIVYTLTSIKNEVAFTLVSMHHNIALVLLRTVSKGAFDPRRYM